MFPGSCFSRIKSPRDISRSHLEGGKKLYLKKRTFLAIFSGQIMTVQPHGRHLWNQYDSRWLTKSWYEDETGQVRISFILRENETHLFGLDWLGNAWSLRNAKITKNSPSMSWAIKSRKFREFMFGQAYSSGDEQARIKFANVELGGSGSNLFIFRNSNSAMRNNWCGTPNNGQKEKKESWGHTLWSA